MSDPSLIYLFDPLCGWCYGAAPGLRRLQELSRIRLTLLPTGLFAGEGAKPMDDGLAAYAWSNDKRIEQLSGQRFTDAYRRKILGDRRTKFDSGAATLALSAVSLDHPEREFETLGALQHARYVNARDIVSMPGVSLILAELGLHAAAERMNAMEPALLDAHRDRISRARALMQRIGARGVPAVAVSAADEEYALPSQALFDDVDAVARRLAV